MGSKSLYAALLAAAFCAGPVSAAKVKDFKLHWTGFTFKVALSHKEVNDLADAIDVPLDGLPDRFTKYLGPIQRALQKAATALKAKDEGNGVVVTFKAGVRIQDVQAR